MIPSGEMPNQKASGRKIRGITNSFNALAVKTRLSLPLKLEKSRFAPMTISASGVADAPTILMEEPIICGMLTGIKEKIIDGIMLIDLDSGGLTAGLYDMKPANIFREDKPKPSLSRKEVLANAGKNIEAGCIRVPKMLERGGE